MASNLTNYEEHADTPLEFKRRKRRRIDSDNSQNQSSTSNHQQEINKWRTPAKQATYSSKLVEAIRHVRRNSSSSSSSASSRSRSIRDAADNALAIAARGRSRWSRAILANRLKLRLKNHNKVKTKSAETTSSSRKLKNAPIKRSSPPLQRRLRVLGGLVPGCRKLSFPKLLEETTDYISALEMQIRVMSALADILTGSSTDNPDRRDITPQVSR